MTNFKNRFSPSTMWVPEMELSQQAWHQVPLPADPSHQSIIKRLTSQINSMYKCRLNFRLKHTFLFLIFKTALAVLKLAL